MVTLIAVYNSDGCVGRCDARCYEATHPECDCICGGANHGAGEDQALANTAAHAERMIADYARARELRDYEARVSDLVYQLPLFPDQV